MDWIEGRSLINPELGNGSRMAMGAGLPVSGKQWDGEKVGLASVNSLPKLQTRLPGLYQEWQG